MSSANTQIEAKESEFTAASALACLGKEQEAKEDKGNNNAQVEDFHIPQRFTKSGRKRAVPFTIKLMKVLSDKRNADIITWMPSGKSFNILKPKAFVADILSEHFKTAKYSSFTRKLHRWGFMRHYRGEEAGAFYHKDFQRGRLDLVDQMTCHKAEPPKSSSAIAAVAPRPTPEICRRAIIKPIAVRPAVSVVTTTPKPVKMLLKIPTSAMRNASITTPTVAAPSMAVNVTTAALPPMAPSLAVGASGSPAMDSQRLNAAIELEVNRRLKERINAVALSRQAFAVSALRQQQLTMPHHNQMAALLLQKQAGLFKNNTPMALGIPQMGYRPFVSEPLPGAPPTNIQGARTA